MSTKLNRKQREYYEWCFNEGEWKHTLTYGGGKTRDGKELIKPCIRIQKTKKRKRYKTYNNIVPNYKEGKGSVQAYQAKFLLTYGIPKNGVISHRCNNPKGKSTTCIEETHMTDADQKDNNDRQKCQHKITKYALPIQARGNLDIGPVFLQDVPINTDSDDEDNQPTLRRSKRIKKNNKKCPHSKNGCCFVNFGQHET